MACGLSGRRVRNLTNIKRDTQHICKSAVPSHNLYITNTHSTPATLQEDQGPLHCSERKTKTEGQRLKTDGAWVPLQSMHTLESHLLFTCTHTQTHKEKRHSYQRLQSSGNRCKVLTPDRPMDTHPDAWCHKLDAIKQSAICSYVSVHKQ